MNDNLQDRPATLVRRPKPAADETVDPVDYSPPVKTTTETREFGSRTGPTPRRGRREVTFPFSTRLSQEVQGLLDEAVAREGITVREAIEQAIRFKWGDYKR